MENRLVYKGLILDRKIGMSKKAGSIIGTENYAPIRRLLICIAPEILKCQSVFHRPEMSQIKAKICLRTNVKFNFHKNVGCQ